MQYKKYGAYFVEDEDKKEVLAGIFGSSGNVDRGYDGADMNSLFETYDTLHTLHVVAERLLPHVMYFILRVGDEKL
jgi:hypothetical protein